MPSQLNGPVSVDVTATFVTMHCYKNVDAAAVVTVCVWTSLCILSLRISVELQTVNVKENFRPVCFEPVTSTVHLIYDNLQPWRRPWIPKITLIMNGPLLIFAHIQSDRLAAVPVWLQQKSPLVEKCIAKSSPQIYGENLDNLRMGIRKNLTELKGCFTFNGNIFYHNLFRDGSSFFTLKDKGI